MSEPGTPPVVGIIGGSGLYEIDGLENVEWRAVESSFGPPPTRSCLLSSRARNWSSCRATDVDIASAVRA